MKYPIELRFKLFSFSKQFVIRDSSGSQLMYVKQKMFRLKEKVEVFGDSSLRQKLFEINADRIIDFSASYSFTAADGSDYGSIRRLGRRSLWSAYYEIIEEGQVDMTIREESPWKKLLESLLSEIPIIGFVLVYLLNPSYIISFANGTLAFRVTKKPSFFERYFVIDKLTEVDADDELRALLGLLMMVLLEQRRG